MSVVIFLTTSSTSPFTAPSDWTSATNTVELVGAGGNGGSTTTSTTAGGGGGSGGYGKLTYSSGTITAGTTTIPFHVGVGGGGTATSNGTIWENATGAATCYTMGSAANGTAAGANGAGGGSGTTVGTPAINYNSSGSSGISGGSSGTGFGGGGGAGQRGPLIAGGAGANGAASGRSGGGGGGNKASAGAANIGGAGSTGAPGALGSPPTGNSGGNGGVLGAPDGYDGGSDGQFWFSSPLTAGSGGGGGGGFTNSSTPGNGGNGGLFGAGGGGAGTAGASNIPKSGGVGADGLIILTYKTSGKEIDPTGFANVNQFGNGNISSGVVYNSDLYYGAGLLPGVVTHGGGTNRTRWNNLGVLVAASAGRVNYDPSTLGVRGLILEEARTNYFLTSQQMGTASHNTDGGTISASNTQAAPDGTVTAETYTTGTVSGTNAYRLFQTFTTSPPTPPMAFSMFVKGGTATNGYLNAAEYGATSGTSFATSVFDISTGALGDSISGTTHGLQGRGNQPISNGWWRPWLSSDVTRVSTFGVNFGVTNINTGNSTPLGYGECVFTSATKTAFLWQGQWEAGLFPTTPIVTPSTSTVTATRDTATTTDSTFLANRGFVIDFITAVGPPASGGQQIVLQLDDGSDTNRVTAYRDSSNAMFVEVVTSSTQVALLSVGSIAHATAGSLAFRIASNDYSASLNGGSVATDSSGTLPSITTARLGTNFAGTNYWNSELLRIRGSTTLTDAQLVSETAAPSSNATVSPSGIAPTNAFGSPTLSSIYTVSPTGISSTNAFGTPTLSSTNTISPTGIGSTLVFGTPTVAPGAVTISPTGFANSNLFGTATVSATNTISPTGIAPTNAFGSPTVLTSQGISPTGIANTNAFGSPTVSPGPVTISPTGISSSNQFGTASIKGSNTISPTGIANTNLFGTPTVAPGTATISPTGIPSTLVFGSATVNRGPVTISPTSIANTNLFGTATVTATNTISPTGLPNTNAFGSPSLRITIGPVGIASTNQFGSPTVVYSQSVSPSGIGSTVLFGSTTVTGKNTIAPSGIASTVLFGTPVVGKYNIISPSGIGSTVQFGTASITITQIISPMGIASTNRFGQATTLDPYETENRFITLGEQDRDLTLHSAPERFISLHSQNRIDVLHSQPERQITNKQQERAITVSPGQRELTPR